MLKANGTPYAIEGWAMDGEPEAMIGKRTMRRDYSLRNLLTLTIPPLAGGAVAWVGFLLPSEVIDILTLWTLLSVAGGMLFGHLVLNED
jgi:hypothetical protein